MGRYVFKLPDVGEGVAELKLDIGPGYRIYFGQHNDSIIVLLLGGNKGTQNDDITRAKTYWKDYKSRFVSTRS